MTEEITLKIHGVPVQEAIKCLLGKRGVIFLFAEDGITPTSVWVMGDESSGSGFGGSVRPATVRSATRSQDTLAPEPTVPDPRKSFSRDSFKKTVQNKEKLFKEIAGNQVNLPPNMGPATSGFKVAEVDTDSIFKEIGLEKGDLITNINGKTITTKEGLVRELGRAAGSQMPSIRIERIKGDDRMDPIYVHLEDSHPNKQ
jgi:type II secretory pathway component PulC